MLAAGQLFLAGCAAASNPSTPSTPAPSLADSPSATASASPAAWVMPDEGVRHTGTWMAFGPSAAIWGAGLVPVVRKNLADIANAIVTFEPVTMLVRPSEQDAARALLDPAVRLLPMEVDDLWVRDTGPVFVTNGSALGAWGSTSTGGAGSRPTRTMPWSPRP